MKNKRKNKKCVICEKEFSPVSSLNKYCCSKCKRLADMRSRSKKPMFKICQNCKEEFKPYTSLDKFCCANCRVESQKNKRGSRWSDESVKKRMGENNPAYRNGNYVRGVRKSAKGERVFIKNSKGIRVKMIDTDGFIYCQRCGVSDSIKYETHHIVFRSEKPYHNNLHDDINLILVCVQCHNDLHKTKGLRNAIVEDRGLNDIFGNDILNK